MFVYGKEKIYGAKFLHLFSPYYHMVGRLSEVLLSKYYDIRIKTVKDNNIEYCVAVQDICIYPEREYILYEWYWPMAYACVLDNTDEKYIFPEFYNTAFKAGESKIYSKELQMFRIFYEIFYEIFQ